MFDLYNKHIHLLMLQKGNLFSLFLILIIGLATSSLKLSAQEYRPHPLLSSMWQADIEYLAPSQVEDTTLKNGFTGGSFNYRFPIYKGKDWLSADGGKPFIAVLGQAGTTVRQTEINFVEPNRLLTNLKTSITGLIATGASSLRNLFLLQINSSLPTESFWFKPQFLRFNGAFIWRKLYHNNRFWHTLGIVYSPLTGRDILLPVIGGGYKINKENQIQITLPFNIAYTHLFSKKFSLSIKINSNGSFNYLKPDTLHFNDPLIYRQRYQKLSISGRYYTDRHVVLTPEIGLTGRSKLSLDENKSTQASTFYFKLSLQVRFGKRPAASPILNFDPGDSGFDPNYLLE